MDEVRVIAIGSAHGSDQMAWKVAGKLGSKHPDIDWQICNQPASMMALMKGYKTVVLIDALQSTLPAGEARLLHLADLADTRLQTSSHGFGVRDALMLGKALNLLPAQLYLIGIAIDENEMSEALIKLAAKNCHSILENLPETGAAQGRDQSRNQNWDAQNFPMDFSPP